MSTQPVIRRTALSAAESRVLLLLVVSGFLNYFDRSNLSAGATDIQRELHLSSYQLGVLLSAFFRTYAAFQLFCISGWLVDRFNVCWILAAGFFLWSAATALTGAAHTFTMVFGLRLLLGMGESIAYPAYSRILANNFPEHHRGFANAVIDAGTKLGPALGTLLGGLLMAVYGWRAFFLALGFSSLLWLAPWLLWMPRGKGVASRQDPAGIPSAWAILRQRSAWFSALGLFCTNYFWYFLLTWLPPYLETERHFSKPKMAWFGSAAYFAVAISGVTAGWVSDRLIARGGTPTRVRKTFCGVGLLFSTLILPVCIIDDDRIAMLLLMLACLSYGLFCANLFAITQTLAGPRAAGKWTGMQNGFGNLAGVAAPWLTGFIVQETGRFYLAFLVASGIALLGAAFFVVGIGPIRQVEWQPASGVPEMLKEQLYFFDVIAFLGGVAVIAVYVPWGPRFYAGMALMAVSLVLWMIARFQLGASFSLDAKARKLITRGLYSKFRNPIYLFGQLAYLGLAIAWGTTAGFVIFALIIPLQLLRAKKEEAVLEQRFGDEYRAYKSRTLL